MIVWLNAPSPDTPRIGLRQRVLRREQVASVMDLDAALAQAQALLDDARQAAEALVSNATALAAQIDDEARERYAQAEAAGHEAGFAQGIAAAHASMQARVEDRRATMQQMGERLAGVVCRAVEQMVGDAGREARLRTVVATLHRMIDAQTHLVLRVHPDDVELARTALLEMSAATDWRGGFDVVPDDGAQPGDCRCEWDDGMLDASLSMQLDALQQALGHAVERMAVAESADSIDAVDVSDISDAGDPADTYAESYDA
ncbi:type III secretion system stator protein SctL [Pandoraea sp. ISTKB]|uniref:type III secretion system stator protein SctL n=1 Tax=Pandoraea sp. ISTKB TaxID=1586708 RepID=UPI00084754E7|nr:type III secretion system stator protein SctL [Pandoraea sp. ISTKB]ODP34722.1 hypothetical protein A9762_14015 [Pandoraea sp. ISTKB]